MSESEFTPQKLKELKLHFNAFDTDGDKQITPKELKEVLERLGMKKTEKEITDIIASVDSNNNGTIEWNEFLQMYKKLQEGTDSGFGQVYNQAAKQITEQGSVGLHTYTEEEKEAFVEYINSTLGNDPDLKDYLPINVKNDQLFESVKDGVLLCKLINSSVAGTIDERVINKKPKNAWQKNENHTLVIASAKGIGCSVVNIGATDLNNGTKHLVLGLVWQIIKIGLLSSISLKDHPELARLLKDGETLADLLKLGPEAILLRWFNYHLEQANHNRRVANFSSDIKDSENYTILLNRISGGKCTKDPLNEKNVTSRAEKMLQQADNIGCKKFVKAGDVVKGNSKLNLAFTANLFNNYPALDPVEGEVIEETREEKAFRLWINSMGIESNFLREDVKDGLILLKVFDKIKPGSVNWKRVNQNPATKFKKLENTNYAVEVAKEFQFSIVNIGGSDILDGNTKLTLAIIWQQMRYAIVSMLSKLSKNGKPVTDSEIVEYANKRVSDAGKSSSIKSFNDPSIKTSVFLIDLCAAIDERAVNYDLVTPGQTEGDASQNAKYVISVARKLGATIFLMHEDILEVKNKMILSLVGSLAVVDQELNNK